MLERERLIAAGLLAATIAWSLTIALVGSTEGLLYMAPLLLLTLPLALGRYLGERVLAELAAARRGRNPRPASESPPPFIQAPQALVRGGRLIAAFLAERAPPVPALHPA